MLSLLQRRARRLQDRADEVEVEQIATAWERAALGAGLVRVVQTVSGPTEIVPRLAHVVLGPPTVLTVRLEPGQTVADFRGLARRLAPHLGVPMLRVEPIGVGAWCRIILLTADPLDGVLPLAPDQAGILLGRTEDDQHVILDDPAELPHTICQGSTRSGKSVWTYGLLAQLAHRDDVLVTGADPTGLLWRPFAGTRHGVWQSSGLADPSGHENVLRRVVAEMDTRIADLPADRDTTPLDPDRPLMLVILEEYPGLLRVLDAAKTRGDDPGGRVRALVSRLLAEGAKAGIRVVLLAQRAEAGVIGALERAQCSLRLSFRVDSRASVDLLHPGADPTLADDHTTAPPGIALLSRPGHDLARIRAPFLGGYPDYVAAVRGPERNGDAGPAGGAAA